MQNLWYWFNVPVYLMNVVLNKNGVKETTNIKTCVNLLCYHLFESNQRQGFVKLVIK